jgi:hypothetical protein
MPLSLITVAHFFISDSSVAASCSGVLPTTSSASRSSPRHGIRRAHRFPDVLVQPEDDFARRALGCDERKPRHELVARYTRRGDRRHAGQCRHRLDFRAFSSELKDRPPVTGTKGVP